MQSVPDPVATPAPRPSGKAAKPAKAAKPRTPPCPITGGRSKLVQRISTSLLIDLWRIMGKVDVSDHYQGLSHVHLYQSDCGLMFFHPPIPGNAAFYGTLYKRWNAHGLLQRGAERRQEFLRAARHVRPGDRVLDVGGGEGDFGRHVPAADFTAIDPYAPPEADARVLRVTAAQHADAAAGSYDVVTAFQVLEHVEDPRGLAADLVRLLKPGGLLILCAPTHPSILTEVPNNLVNAPPHHLTWWNETAFAALAAEFGLEVLENEVLPGSPHQTLFGWLDRFLIVRTRGAAGGPYYAHRWSWHAGLAIGYSLAWVADKVLGERAVARPSDGFLVARKPL
ncbi:class I SAM-dependent methyltransferase [Methylobrevis albus]|uniref:Class I SAM-dependent methyltransferase n=1 Tax=Methylobrevis albus TaxID=2793297 RepID=A0A931HZ15_9HYPH|nr:class I SAM-dependent methyltransferase [Methylobrevis albus]MBH0236294.1 class I SAM-dependent methyltransferase [Methylobrevis albus]